MEIVLISGKKEIMKAIDGIQRTGKKLDEQIHVCAVSCLAHAEQHGDVTLCTRLAHALPKHSRRKALIYWFTQFGPLTYSEKENQFKVLKSEKVKPYEVERASNTPFWDYTPEKNVEPFTVAALLKLVQRKFKQAKEKGELKDNDLATFKKEVQELSLQA
jgi:hypothetical protein